MRQDILTGASVKVMRSFDYCHFEIILGTAIAVTLQDVDAMRKEAARLADKAVEQYKVAKAAAESATQAQRTIRCEKSNIERIRALAETDRSETDEADLKSYEDAVFRANRRYDYEDDWQDAEE